MVSNPDQKSNFERIPIINIVKNLTECINSYSEISLIFYRYVPDFNIDNDFTILVWSVGEVFISGRLSNFFQFSESSKLLLNAKFTSFKSLLSLKFSSNDLEIIVVFTIQFNI